MTYIFDITTYETTDDYKRYTGLGFADSFAEAMRQLEDMYGDEMVTVNHLELIDSCGAVCNLPWEVLHDVIADKWFNGTLCDKDGNPLET